MDKITQVRAYQVLDSRGNPTIKVTVKTEKFRGSAFVPSGASTGIYEALELRDKKRAYGGKGVERAVENVNKKIFKAIVGMSVLDQAAIDDKMRKLDGTENKSSLGANAILGVSLAVARVAARVKGVELFEHIADLYGNKKRYTIPVPLANIINGGKHAGNFLKVQEFMLIPTGTRSFSEAARMVAETYHVLKKLIDDKYGHTAVNVGDEGGFAPPLKTPEEALDLVSEAIKRAGYKRKLRIGLDVAASELYHDNHYDLGVNFTREDLIAYYDRLAAKYDLRSIEDPFDQDDNATWAKLTATVAKKRKLQIVGDDLLVSNPTRVRMGIANKLCNALLLKVNQIGTLTEAMQAARMAMDSNWEVVVSHRSGETEDPFIADLAVGIGASEIKLGAPCRGERTSKYNRLIEIEANLSKSTYAAKNLKF